MYFILIYCSKKHKIILIFKTGRYICALRYDSIVCTLSFLCIIPKYTDFCCADYVVKPTHLKRQCCRTRQAIRRVHLIFKFTFSLHNRRNHLTQHIIYGTIQTQEIYARKASKIVRHCKNIRMYSCTF